MIVHLTHKFTPKIFSLEGIQNKILHYSKEIISQETYAMIKHIFKTIIVHIHLSLQFYFKNIYLYCYGEIFADNRNYQLLQTFCGHAYLPMLDVSPLGSISGTFQFQQPFICWTQCNNSIKIEKQDQMNERFVTSNSNLFFLCLL